MPSSWSLILGYCALTTPMVTAVPLQDNSTPPSNYAPQPMSCLVGALVREGNALADAEKAYLAGRKPVADKALASWLTKVDPAFETSGKMPTMGLAASGGGYRAFLTGAGVVQGLDSQDTIFATGGLWQAISYHAGLSGGAWLVSALAANGWPTISS
jgi:lysophospholipase